MGDWVKCEKCNDYYLRKFMTENHECVEMEYSYDGEDWLTIWANDPESAAEAIGKENNDYADTPTEGELFNNPLQIREADGTITKWNVSVELTWDYVVSEVTE